MQKSCDHDDNYLLDVESNSLRVILVHCDDTMNKNKYCKEYKKLYCRNSSTYRISQFVRSWDNGMK